MDILFEVKNSTGIITLNRPNALNALNLNMAVQFSNKLREWENNNKIERVLLIGNGKHFCAGGDVKSVHLSGPFSKLKSEFFSKEYSLNLQIKKFPKPWILIGFSSTDKSRTWKNNYFAQLIQLLNKNFS